MVQGRVRIISGIDAADPSFDITDDAVMATLHDAEERHFWHRTRNRWIADRLKHLGLSKGSSIVELGCGAGCVTSYLSQCGYDMTGVEGHPALLERAAIRAPQCEWWQHDLSRGVGELPNKRFDAAGMFDVIEHLDRPADALRGALSLVRAGGVVVGTVPAMQGLWSRIDEQSGHKVRYERGQLRSLVGSVDGAELIEVVAMNRLLVPVMWLQRRMVSKLGVRTRVAQANLAVPWWPVNEAMHAMLRMEGRATKWLEWTRMSGASLWFAIRRTSL